jgi:molybdenum cofactor cytidylyltransferase
VIAAVLLAAGEASRYGSPKLLERFEGESLLRRAARAFTEAGCAPLIAVLGALPGLREELGGIPALIVENREPGRGIAHSIALGVESLPEEAAAVLIGVADQPLLDAAAVRLLVRAFRPGRIVAPRYGTVPGNPRLYDRRFFPELRGLEGDRGAQILADRHPEAVDEVALPERCGLDVDTPGDWARIGTGTP